MKKPFDPATNDVSLVSGSHTVAQWMAQSYAITTLDGFVKLWCQLAVTFTPDFIRDTQIDDANTVLQHIWDNTCQRFVFPWTPDIIEQAYSFSNFTVLNFLLKHDAQYVCERIRLLRGWRGPGNPLQSFFFNAVQHNEVEFVAHTVAYVPKTDHYGHNFMSKNILIAAQNAFDRGHTGKDDPLFGALWNGASWECKNMALMRAQSDYEEAPHSPVRQETLHLIERQLCREERMRLEKALEITATDNERFVRKM